MHSSSSHSPSVADRDELGINGSQKSHPEPETMGGGGGGKMGELETDEEVHLLVRGLKGGGEGEGGTGEGEMG